MTSQIALPGPVDDGPGHRSSSDPRPTILAGILVMALTVFGFGLWSATTPLARGAHVTGKVVSDSNRKTIQHLEGGIVQEILVSEGQRVEAGQVLIRLEPTRALTTREVLFARQVHERLLEARLMAELSGDAELRLPPDLETHWDDPRVVRELTDQQALMEARRNEMEGQVGILQDRVRQLQHQIQGFKGSQTANREEHRLTQDEIERLGPLHRRGYVPLDRLRALERAAAELEGEYASMTAEIARTEVAVGEARLEIIQARQSFRRQLLDELGQVRNTLSEIDEQLAAANDVLARTEIRAPQAGQVVGLGVHTAGGVVRPGQPVLDIVPEGDRLIVEAQLQPLDADVVYPGLPAEIRFSSLPRRTAPRLKGIVETMSTDTLHDPANGRSYYLLRVAVPEEEMAILGDVTIMPGMPAEVLIKAGERTLADYLISPWRDLFEKAMRED